MSQGNSTQSVELSSCQKRREQADSCWVACIVVVAADCRTGLSDSVQMTMVAVVAAGRVAAVHMAVAGHKEPAAAVRKAAVDTGRAAVHKELLGWLQEGGPSILLNLLVHQGNCCSCLLLYQAHRVAILGNSQEDRENFPDI